MNRITGLETADAFNDSADGTLMQAIAEMEGPHVNNIGKLEWFKIVFMYLPFPCLITIDRLLLKKNNCKQLFVKKISYFYQTLCKTYLYYQILTY